MLFVVKASFLLDQFVVMKHLVCRMELVDVQVVRKVVPLVVMMVESLVVLSAPLSKVINLLVQDVATLINLSWCTLIMKEVVSYVMMLLKDVLPVV